MSHAQTTAAGHTSPPPSMSPPLVVRECSSPADCALVAKLCGDSFPEECHGQGLSVAEWQQIEAEELSRTPSWWRQIGAAGWLWASKFLLGAGSAAAA